MSPGIRQKMHSTLQYGGITQEVYSILDWYEAGKTFSVRSNSKNIVRNKEKAPEGRYEFIGNLAPDEIRSKYRYKFVEHYFERGNSNPIMYVNICNKTVL